MSSSLMALRANSEANTAEQKRLTDKRRNILILIHHHLIENGYVEAAERLQHETGNALCKFGVADNVDLGLILGEYEAYYEMRFDKKPKLVRKLKDDEELSRPTGSRLPRNPESAGSQRQAPRNKGATTAPVRLPSVNGATSSTLSTVDDEPTAAGAEGFGVNGTSIVGTSVEKTNCKQKRLDDPIGKESHDERYLNNFCTPSEDFSFINIKVNLFQPFNMQNVETPTSIWRRFRNEGISSCNITRNISRIFQYKVLQVKSLIVMCHY